jgi:hypothetical protein
VSGEISKIFAGDVLALTNGKPRDVSTSLDMTRVGGMKVRKSKK